MPIKWSALRVTEAMDMVEEFVNEADQPLEQAKIVAREARNIANLPSYMDDRLVGLICDIERIDKVKDTIIVGAGDCRLQAAEECAQPPFINLTYHQKYDTLTVDG